MEYTFKAVKLEPVSSSNMADPHDSSSVDIPRNASDWLVSSISIKEEPIDLKIELVDHEESLFDFFNPNLLKVPTILKEEVTDDALLGTASTEDGDLNSTTSSVVAETSSQPVQKNVLNTASFAGNDPINNFDNQSNEFTVNRRKLPSRPKLGEHNELMMYMMHEPEFNLFKSFTTIPPKDLWSSPDKVSTNSNNDFTGFSPDSSSFSAHKLIRMKELIQNCSNSEDEESIFSHLHRDSENIQYQSTSAYFSGASTNCTTRRIKRKRSFDEFCDIDSDSSSYSPPKKQRSLKKIDTAFQKAIESFEVYDSEKNVYPRRNIEKFCFKNSTKKLLLQISGEVDDYYNLNPQNCSGISQIPLTYKSPARKNCHPSKRACANQHHYNVRSGEKNPRLNDESTKKLCLPPSNKYSSLLLSLKKHNLGDIIKRQMAVEERIKATLCKTKMKDFNKQECEIPKNCLMSSSSSRNVQTICPSHSPQVTLHKLTPHCVNKKFAEHHQVSIKSAAMIYLQLLCIEKSRCTTDQIYPSATLYEGESSATEDMFDPVITSIHSLRAGNSSHCSESEKEYLQDVDSEQAQLENFDGNNLLSNDTNNTLLVVEQQNYNSNQNKHLHLDENELKNAQLSEQSEQSDHPQEVECAQRVEHVQLSECAQDEHVQHINHAKNVDHEQHVSYAQHEDCALHMEHVQLVDNAFSLHNAPLEKEHLQEVNRHPNELCHQNEELMLSQFHVDQLPSGNNYAHNDLTRDILLHKCVELQQDLHSHHDDIPNTNIMHHNDDFHLDSLDKYDAIEDCNEQIKSIPALIDPSESVDVENFLYVNKSQSESAIENPCMPDADTVGAFEHADASTRSVFLEKMSSIQIHEQSNLIGLDSSFISLAEEDSIIERAKPVMDDKTAQRHKVPQAKLYNSILVGKSYYTIEQSKSINGTKDVSNDCLPKNSPTKKSCPVESIQPVSQTVKIPHLNVLMATENYNGQVEQQNFNIVQRENPQSVSSLQQTEHNNDNSMTQVKHSVSKILSIGGSETITPTRLDKATKQVQFPQQPLKSLAGSPELQSVASLLSNDIHSDSSKESTIGALKLQLANQGAASTTCSREKLNNVELAGHPIQTLNTISSSKATTSSATLPPPDLVTIDSDDDSNDDLQVLSENVKKVSRSTLRLTLFVPQMLGNKSVSEITKHYSIVKKNSNGIAQEVTLQSLIDNCDSNGKVYLKRKTSHVESQLDNSDDIQCLGEVTSAVSQMQNKSNSLQEKDSATSQESPLLLSEGGRNLTSTSEVGASSFAVSQRTVQLLDSQQKSVEQYLRHRFQSQSNEIQKRKILSMTSVMPRAKPVVAVVQPMITSSFNADSRNNANTSIT